MEGTEDSEINRDIIQFLKDRGIVEAEIFYSQLTADRRNVVARLVFGDIQSYDKNFDTFWNRFCESHSEWKLDITCNESSSECGKKRDRSITDLESFSVLFWTSHNDLENLLVLRKQTFGLCFMHAPVVLQHYYVTIGTGGVKDGITNIGCYEAKSLTDDELASFIVSDEGGSSENFLLRICGLSPIDVDTIAAPNPNVADFDSIFNKIAAYIQRGLPALVSRFVVHEDFLDPGLENSFCGTPQGGTSGDSHAMVLIGCRKTTNTDHKPTYYYLLQNWCDEEYFVEVDADYFCHCRPMITFILKTLTDFGESDRLGVVSPFFPFYETSTDKKERAIREKC